MASSSDNKPRGILKRKDPPLSTPSGRTDSADNRLKWDEDNLLLNESQRDATMKIDEPKTPFVHHPPSDSDEDIPELTIVPAEPSISFSSAQVVKLNDPEEIVHSLPEDDWDMDEDNNKKTDLEHKNFLSKRHEHYNMKEALKKGSILAKQDLNEADDGNELMD